MKYIIATIVIGILALLLTQAVFLSWRINMGKNLAKNTSPFSYTPENPSQRILVIGDSTAYGTGARVPELSIAGQFHDEFPEAEIVNISKNGAKPKELTSMITQAEGAFDLVLVQAGANDILYFTSISAAQHHMTQLLQAAKKYSDQVVLITAGNIGSAPMFSPPLSWWFTARSQKFLLAFREIAKREGVAMVDVYAEPHNDILLTDTKKYYAADGLHLTSEGYNVWYQEIRETMAEANITL